MRSANRIWVAQFVWAFLGGLPFLLFPRLIMESTTGRSLAEIPLIEVDQVRIVGAASMGLCLATALACTRQALAWQRGMAAIFLVFMLQWSATLTFNQATGHYGDFVPFVTVVPALFFALLNAVILLQPGRTAPIPRTRADSPPTRLRWLWAIQGAWYLGEAALALLAAEWVLGQVTGLVPGDASLTQIAVQQVRIISAWTLTLALVSIYASLEHRIRDWRQYRWVFLLALLIRAGAIAMNAQAGPDTGSFQPLVAATLGVPALAFAYLGFRWTLGQGAPAYREADDPKPLDDAHADAPAPPAGGGVVWLWFIQTLLLIVLGLLCLIAPASLLGQAVAAESEVRISPYATDALRLSGALLLGIAGFTLFALMMSRTVYRRRFAAVFSLAFAISCILLWLEIASKKLYSGSMAAVCSVLTLFAVLNLNWAIRRPPGALSQDDAGVAGSKPPSSYIGWLVQLLAMGVAGVALLLAADSVLGFLSGGMSAGDGAQRLIHNQWQLVGVLSVTIAVLTAVGMASQRDPVWRGFAFFGSVAFVLLSVVLIFFVTSTGRYQLVALVALGAGLLFFAMNRWIRRHPATWNTEDSSLDVETWTILDLVAGPLMALQVLLTKRRASHLVGAGARGSFTVSDNVGQWKDGEDRTFPPNDFFEPGKEFPVQARFANLTELDDASLDVRGCAIKFSDQPYESPLDLLMNTGTYCPAFNLVTFAGFVASKFVPTFGSAAIVRSNLVAREGGIAGLRRAPDSYANLHYYGQIVRHWIDTDGVRHLVRYRCVPDEDGPESGLPTDEDASHIWKRSRLGDEYPKSYLRAELHKRLEGKGKVKMRLQAQFHTPEPGDTDDWYNASVEWDERICPWVELGRLKLKHALSPVDTEVLQFDPGNHHMTLGIPRSNGPLDFRSMGDSEARVVRSLQRFRLWMARVFGPPALAP